MPLRKIDKLIASSFTGPYVLSFFIAEFTLVMQFMWKYVDDILGKGVSMLEVLELLGYYCVVIVPLALPISILISSVMVYGDMAEKYELTSMKSAGVGLLRIMGPGIVIALLTFCLSLFASNYLKPVANYQFYKRFDAIKRAKSSLFIEEGIFNDDFSSFVIRAGKKYPNDKDMTDVFIYDQSKGDPSMLNLIKSDSANMYTEESGKYFIMQLHKGTIYQEEARKQNSNGTSSYPFVRTAFEKYKKVLDMTEFSFSETMFDMSRSKEDMLNSLQLLEEIDSIDRTNANFYKQMEYDFNGIVKARFEPEKLMSTIAAIDLPIPTPIDTLKSKKRRKRSIVPDSVLAAARTNFNATNSSIAIKQKNLRNLGDFKNFYSTFDSLSVQNVISRGVGVATSKSDGALNAKNNLDQSNRSKQLYIMKLNQHFANAFICILFLFIGAPLGSIIRKGGYGYPLLVSILFYMVFIISSIMGTKLLKSESLNGFNSAWIPCFIMLPFAIYFTYKALNDSKFEALQRFATLVSNTFSKKKIQENGN